MPGMNSSYATIAETLSNGLFNLATSVLGHSTIFGAVGYFSAKLIASDEEQHPQNPPSTPPSIFKRAISSIKKIPAFLSYYIAGVIALEGFTNEPTTKFYLNTAKEKMRPIITSFCKPTIEKIVTVMVGFLEQNGFKVTIEQISEGLSEHVRSETMAKISPGMLKQIFSLFSEKGIADPSSIGLIAEEAIQTCTLQNLEGCLNQSLAFLEETAPYAGENMLHLLENILEHAPSSLELPGSILNAISKETGLPYYATFLITSGILAAAGSAVYGLMSGKTNVNQQVSVNQNQNSIQNASANAVGGHVTVQNLVLPENMAEQLLNIRASRGPR